MITISRHGILPHQLFPKSSTHARPNPVPISKMCHFGLDAALALFAIAFEHLSLDKSEHLSLDIVQCAVHIAQCDSFKAGRIIGPGVGVGVGVDIKTPTPETR